MAEIDSPLCHLPQGITDLHDRYRRCARVKTQGEADEFLEELAEDHCNREDGVSLVGATRIERANIGYWAGCYLRWDETQRVFALFRTSSPIFGDYHPDVHEAFWAGVRVAVERIGRPMRAEELMEMQHWTSGLPPWKPRG